MPKSAVIIIIFIAIIASLAIIFLLSPKTEKETSAPLPLPMEPLKPVEKTPNETNPAITLKTNKGDITIELFMDKAPVTAGNFLKLAREDFYRGIKFHRVIPGFMIQSGDPNSKGEDTSLYGQGGPGYTIEDELIEGLSNVRGTISMANTGAPNSGGSQFFINIADNTNLDFDKEPLTSKHPVFGRVTEGMDIVDAISKVPTQSNDLPVDPVIIEDIVINE